MATDQSGAPPPPFAWRPKLPLRLSSLTGLTVDEVVDRLFKQGDPQTLRIEPLGGAEITLRPGTSDVYVLRETFVGLFHLPPPGIDPRVILDLGSNIGTTMAHFAHLYSDARIYGVELDEDNAELCARNIARWSDRCKLLHTAVAARDGATRYDRQVGIHRWAFRIGSGSSPTATMSLDTILDRFRIHDIDYVKMDIEGAEREVLRNPGRWPRQVRSLKVEVHDPYTVNEALADLEELGFAAQPHDRHESWVVARRA